MAWESQGVQKMKARWRSNQEGCSGHLDFDKLKVSVLNSIPQLSRRPFDKSAKKIK